MTGCGYDVGSYHIALLSLVEAKSQEYILLFLRPVSIEFVIFDVM